MVRRLVISGVYRTTALLVAALLFLLGGVPWLRLLPGMVAVDALTYARLGPGDGCSA